MRKLRMRKVKTVLRAAWQRLTKLGALFTTVVGTIGLCLGIAIFVLNWFVGQPTTPSYVAATRQFVRSVADASAILEVRRAAARQAVIDNASRQLLARGTSIFISPECERGKPASCDIIVKGDGGTSTLLFDSGQNSKIGDVARNIADYSRALEKILDAPEAHDFDLAIAQVSSVVASILSAQDAVAPAAAKLHPQGSLWQRLFPLRVQLEYQRRAAILAAVQIADPAINVLGAALARSAAADVAVELANKLEVMDAKAKLLSDENSNIVNRQRALAELVESVRNLRILGLSDPIKTISSVRTAHKALFESLAGSDPQKAFESLRETRDALAALKEVIDRLKAK